MNARYVDNCCCAYCRVLRESRVLKHISESENVVAFSPVKIKKEKHCGSWETLEKRIFPGYIFIYGKTEEDIREAARNAHVRLLQYSDGTCLLQGNDRLFAKWIFEHDGVMTVSKAVSCGDSVLILEGPLADLRGTVTEIDKRRRLMKVKLDVNEFSVWLSFDWATNEQGFFADNFDGESAAE
ncbi:MAG: hypothetical protein IKG85_09050 [Clostridia bacterium]|nr:hypothetical protein [Clostridia bacterium]